MEYPLGRKPLDYGSTNSNLVGLGITTGGGDTALGQRIFS